MNAFRHLASVIAVSLAMLHGFAARAADAFVDAHTLYEKQCGACHTEHAADLSRQKFSIVSEQLQVSRTGVPVENLLRDHHGVRLDDAQQAALGQLFTLGLKWAGVFQHRCVLCHGKAVTFAREKLVLEDDQLIIRGSRIDVAGFLATHGDATPKEIETLLEMFRYQIRTAPQQ
ncbi:MAG: hypothetical protein ABL907_10265 [Hyphomicrobium sp.]